MINYPLHDTEFLKKLFTAKEREVFVRVTALTQDERPIEYIEGKATGGSINIDGASRVRRTCSLTLIAQDININDFHWGLKNKFKLEIGLKNKIDSRYPDIIWFKQGLYVITSFNVSLGTNNYTINISGKDKMCLLNGDLAGTLPHTTDFGIEEYYDAATDTTTYTSVPIRRIIQESIQNFGNELPQNIIINDLEDAGLELLEYRGDRPIYMFREVNSDSFINMTVNNNQKCWIVQSDGSLYPDDDIGTIISNSKEIIYDNLTHLSESEEPTKITLSNKEDAKQYTVAKFEYGSIPGYRLTDLVYAGDLISNVGETLTSMLDKIVNMLGEFEYFYNLDGKFVFQKKQTYIDVYWNNVEKDTDEIYANAAINKSIPMWSFLDGQLVSAFQNAPNLLNLRNDYAVWGKKKTTSGTELDIHMRYAIDTKPTDYFSLLDNKWYSIDAGADSVDWRELIYKMALDYRRFYHDDDFLYRVSSSNIKPGETTSLYPTGRTGYEQYYVDMEGFWRQLYDPKPTALKFTNADATDFGEDQDHRIEDAYIKYALIPGDKKTLRSTFIKDPYKIYVIDDKGNLKPFLQGFIHLNDSPDVNYKFLNTKGEFNNTKDFGEDSRIIEMNRMRIYEFYIENVLEWLVLHPESKEHVPIYSKDVNGIMTQLKVIQYSTGQKVEDSIRFIDAMFEEALNKLNDDGTLLIDEETGVPVDRAVQLYIFATDDRYTKYTDLTDNAKKFYCKNNTFITKINHQKYDNFGKELNEEFTSLGNVNYYTSYHEFNDSGWAKEVTDNPENLLFWFDFIDPEEADLAKYSVKAVGVRSKALNDTNVKSIYYREIPKTIFQSGVEIYEHQTGYTYIQLQGTMENLFTISSKGKSAQEAIEELLYKYSYCIESTTITALPVYHLEPNTRILVRDSKSGIDGEYAISKITIPLTYNGTMSLTATKVVSNITF